MSTTLDTLQRAYANYARLLLLVTEQIANPTAAGVDAIVAAAQAGGLLTPKPTVTVDGESYDWVGYQTFLIQQMEALKRLIALESGPYEVRSYGGC
jgi:hypothetical protein